VSSDPRDLEEVPPRELAALLQDATTVMGWGRPDSLFREALHRLGRVRLTTGVQQTLAAVVPLAQALDADDDLDLDGVPL
jgi:hypothetical protein